MNFTGANREAFEAGVKAERNRIANIIQGMKPGADNETVTVLDRVAQRIYP